MRTFIVFLFLLCYSGFGFSQEGYLSKRNVLTAEFFANSPLILNSKNPHYVLKNGKMAERKELLNYGYGLYYIRQIKNKLGLGLELNVKNVSIDGPGYIILSNISDQLESIDTVWLKANPFSVNVYSGMMRFEFYNKLGNGPIGLVHTLGIGMALSKSVQKGYDYSLNEFGNAEGDQRWSKPDKFFLMKGTPSIKSVALQYGIQIRYPISRQFSVNFGLKSLFNITLPMNKEKLASMTNSPYLMDDLYYKLRRENIFSLNLNAGISYHF